MSYLLDKKNQRKKFITIILFVLLFSVFILFRSSILGGLSSFSNFVFRPFLSLGNVFGDKLYSISSYFSSKSALLQQKQNLENMLEEERSLMSNYTSVLDENFQMKEILGRKNSKSTVLLSGILAKPNQSLYDTLIVDAGTSLGVRVDDRVFAFGNVPIGRVAEVYEKSSKVILFSNPGEKTDVVISGKNIFMQLIGRGGGNFEMVLMNDLALDKGTEVVLPGVNSYVLATVETTISDPRDSFVKVLLSSPVNIQELKFVQIVK